MGDSNAVTLLHLGLLLLLLRPAAASLPCRHCRFPLQREYCEAVLLLLPPAIFSYESLPQLAAAIRPNCHNRLAAGAEAAPPRGHRLR